MPGARLGTSADARARRELLLVRAAAERRQVGAYLDALDPAARLAQRFVSAVRFLLGRPAVAAGVLAAVVALRPRRALRLLVWAMRAFTGLRRLVDALR